MGLVVALRVRLRPPPPRYRRAVAKVAGGSTGAAQGRRLWGPGLLVRGESKAQDFGKGDIWVSAKRSVSHFSCTEFTPQHQVLFSTPCGSDRVPSLRGGRTKRGLSRGYYSQQIYERACASNVSCWLDLPARAKRNGGSSSLRHDTAQINDERSTSTQTSMQCCSTLCVRSWKTSLRSVSSTGTRFQCGWITFHVRRYMPSIALHRPSWLPESF